MTHSKWLAALGAGTMTLLGACAPAPAPPVGVIYAEPTFDKFGNPSCRPGDVPIGGAYTADLPICAVIDGAPVVVVADVDAVEDANGVVIVDPTDPDDPTDPGGGNQNQNRNNNQNNSQNQNNQQSGGG